MIRSVHFLSKADVIRFVRAYPGLQRGVYRGLDSGVVEFLGGFSKIPPFDYSGFILQITTKYRTVYNVAIVYNTNHKAWTAYVLKPDMPVPWIHWDGRVRKEWSVYDGDNPIEYKQRKKKASIKDLVDFTWKVYDEAQNTTINDAD